MKNLSQKISHTLKSLRQSKAWSLDVASQQTGVSKAMLGQIERGESSPTISTLWKIATGFEVSFSSFIENLDSSHLPLIHINKSLKQLHPKDDKIRVMPLFPYEKSLKFEVFIIELLPKCEHLSPGHKKGVVEHIIVSSGEIEVMINNIWHPLKQQEGLRFNADQPHGYRNVKGKKAVFHNMIHYS